MRLTFRSTITVNVIVRTDAGESPWDALRRMVACSEDLAANLAYKEGTYELLGTPDPLPPSEDARRLAAPFIKAFSQLHICHGHFDGRNAAFLAYNTGSESQIRLVPLAMLVTPALFPLIPALYLEESDGVQGPNGARQLTLWEDDND